MIDTSPNGILEMPKITGPDLKYGDSVKIINGPLAGRVGVFQHSEKERVMLLLSLLGRETSVTMPIENLSYAGAVS